MSKEEILQKNIDYSKRYFQDINKAQIPSMIREIVANEKIRKIIDLGCGDCMVISAIIKKHPTKEIVGVDISPRQINNLKKKYPSQQFLCGDVSNTELKSNHFDLAICEQVIEHLESDKMLLEEVYRILKNYGYFYISSVIKKPWAIYKYRNNGKFVLDPTHVREYKSKNEFLDLLRKNNFEILKSRMSLVKRKLFGINISIFGYYEIGVLCKKG